MYNTKKEEFDSKRGTIYKTISRIIQIATGILIIGMLIGWIIIPTENVRYKFENAAIDDIVWTFSDSGQVCNKRKLKLEIGETVRIEAILPQVSLEDYYVGFYDWGFDTTAFIGGTRIFVHDFSATEAYGKELGEIWNHFPLDEKCGGKKLSISLTNNGKISKWFNTGSIIIGKSNDLLYKVFTSSLLALIESVLFFVLTLILFVASFVLHGMNYKKQSRLLRKLCFFAGSATIWIYSSSSLSQLFYSSASLKYGFYYISFLIIPIAACSYFREVLEDQRRLFSILITSYEIILLIILPMHVFNIVHISMTVWIPYFFFVFTMIYVGYKMIKQGIKNYSRSRAGNIIAFVTVIVFFIIGFFFFFSSRRTQTSLYMGHGMMIFLIVISITEIRQMIKEFFDEQRHRHFNQIASVDPVTGGNSRVVAERWLVSDERKACREPWLMQVNLKKFGIINSILGWDNGDIILGEVYKRIEEIIWKNELICSLGDSNFIILIPEPKSIDNLCYKITRSINEYMDEKWHGLSLELEYAALPITEELTMGQLLNKVRQTFDNPLAEYHSADRIYYYAEACSRAEKERAEIESWIPDALSGGEFEMYLQPKINPRGDVLEAAEALIRWNRKGEMIYPNRFIPILEQNGLIAQVDLYMFRKACEYLVFRKVNGLPNIKISVNVSKYTISSADSWGKYKAIIDELKVPTENLEIEITESMAFDDMEGIENLITQIHESGVRVSMDDFGSAYSNLSAIGRLKFDVVKFDKKLIEQFPENEQDFKMIRGLVGVFRDMGIEVVCEGVESEKQNEALKDIGTDLIQGYVYSKPISQKEFENKSRLGWKR